MLPPAVRSARLRLVARPLVVLLASAGLVTGLAGPSAAAPVPPTPSNLPADIEQRQPYVGQTTCDPVAKPGVRAFSSMVLNTYRSTSSLGIVRDCGAGGQSEHKEGRAWDWGVNYYDAARRADAAALLNWLTATDGRGNDAAMARRLGIMYMIWNKQIWKSYDSQGWQPYSGPNPHTDHVHFSFGWNGAKQVTSYWDGTVAPVDYGPNAPASVIPVRSPANLAVLRTYSDVVLKVGSTGEAVKKVQSALRITVDGSYGSQTATAVSNFQKSQALTATGEMRKLEWQRLFPPPIDPFGAHDVTRVDLATVHVSGWTIDADTTNPLQVNVYGGGRLLQTALASAARTDVERSYPGFGSDVGFRLDVVVPEGEQEICVQALNASGTPGVHTNLGCRTVTVKHSPFGEVGPSAVQPPGSPEVQVTGYAIDPNTTDPIRVHVYADDAGGVQSLAADLPDPAAGAAHPTYGEDHGFRASPVLNEGSRVVCLYAINATDTPGSNRGLGCRSVTVRHTPFGSLDLTTSSLGAVQVRGWALDPDTVDPVPVRLFVNGGQASAVLASTARPDVAAAHAGYGDDLGFAKDLTLPEGTREVCAVAVNAAGTPGADRRLGCRTVDVRHSPTGVVDRITTTPTEGTTPGRTAVTGWALDPDSTGSVTVHAYVDGKPVAGTAAALPDQRSSARWPQNGDAHGYRFELDLAEGSRQVCLFAINAGGTPGAHTRLGCQTVTVRHTAFGSLDSVTSPAAGTVRVKGWAIDPDTTAPVTVHAYVDGKAVAGRTANAPRADVARVHPAYGPDHGFLLDLSTTPGQHSVCVFAINAGGTPGGNPRLACRTVTVS